jgi:diacylglycerol kinase (ATP)
LDYTTKTEAIQLKLLIIFNPKAAYGRSARKLEEINLKFNSVGIETCILSTEYSGHARKLVKSARLSDFDGVVAAGGDGTVFEVLNGLYKHPKPTRIPLGILPIGTGNVIAR